MTMLDVTIREMGDSLREAGRYTPMDVFFPLKEILATLDRVEVLEKALTDIMAALSARNFDNMAEMIKGVLKQKGTQ